MDFKIVWLRNKVNGFQNSMASNKVNGFQNSMAT